jgi:hypothetical protein
MNRQQYRKNRVAFPADELARYSGQWVAFSLDGCRIFSSALALEQLEEQLAALGATAGRFRTDSRGRRRYEPRRRRVLLNSTRIAPIQVVPDTRSLQ